MFIHSRRDPQVNNYVSARDKRTNEFSDLYADQIVIDPRFVTIIGKIEICLSRVFTVLLLLLLLLLIFFLFQHR